jgi:hypothetical protein
MKPGIRLMAWFDRASSGGAAIVHDVIAEFEVESLPPGSSTEASLWPLHPDLWPDRPVGTRFDFWEPGHEPSWAEVLQPLIEVKTHQRPRDIGAS